LADIRAGLPQIYAVTRELFVAQMLNLDLIDGISFTKGCFTGQEIIARTQHLGRIKRRMFRLGLPPGAWSVGQAVRLDDGRTGRLLEVGPAGETGESQEALAVLTLDPVGGEPVGGIPDGEELERAALAAVTLPLPYAWPPALGSHDAPH
jgi:folate-binding protein YgfZ